MTSVSSLGSTLTQYQSPLSSLDKNGDGIISADELAAAGQTSASSTSTSSTSSTDGSSSASAADLINKVKSDILALMLSLQQQSDSSDSQSADGAADDSTDDAKGIFASMDTNGDGKLTEAEFLAADPQKTSAADGSDNSDPAVTGILQDMQAAILAYKNTYGASAAADTATNDVQPA